MNTSKIYDKISGRITEELPSEEQSPQDLILQSEYDAWLNSSVTKNIFKHLNLIQDKLVESATNFASVGANDKAAVMLIKIKTIKEIIELCQKKPQ